MTGPHARAGRRFETGASSPRVSLADGIARTRTCRPRLSRGARRADCFLPAMPPRAWGLWGNLWLSPADEVRSQDVTSAPVPLGSDAWTDRSFVCDDDRRKEVRSSEVKTMRIISNASGTISEATAFAVRHSISHRLLIFSERLEPVSDQFNRHRLI